MKQHSATHLGLAAGVGLETAAAAALGIVATPATAYLRSKVMGSEVKGREGKGREGKGREGKGSEGKGSEAEGGGGGWGKHLLLRADDDGGAAGRAAAVGMGGPADEDREGACERGGAASPAAFEASAGQPGCSGACDVAAVGATCGCSDQAAVVGGGAATADACASSSFPRSTYRFNFSL